MKIRYFFYGVLVTSIILMSVYLNKSSIRQAAQPIINYVKHGDTSLDSIDIKLKRSAPIGESVKTITTNNLPIYMEYTDLTPSGFMQIGHIESLNSSLIMMDRIGSFYEFKDNEIIDLKTRVPSNIDDYFNNHGLGQSDMRSFSFVIDCKNSKLYASFMQYTGNDQGRISLQSIFFNCLTGQRFKSSTWEEIYNSELLDLAYLKGSHNGGGAVAHDKDYVYLSVGFTDGVGNISDIEELVAQSDDSDRGKILRINKITKNSEIFSKGHRNLQDLIFVDNTELYGIEQGPQGGDELNLIKKNFNYGWPMQTFGTKYGMYDHQYEFKDLNTILSDFTDPVFAFVPSIAGCTIIQINNFNKAWDSDILIGSLKARSLYRLKLHEGNVIFSEHIWIGKRIRSLAKTDSAIYAITDDNFLIEISINKNSLVKNYKYDDSYAFNPSFTKCQSCHNLAETTDTSSAPSLKNIIGRKIAGTNYKYYSDSLSSIQGNWDENKLKLYLKNPELFAPDTTMPRINLSDKEIIDITNFLMEYSY